MRLRSTGRRIRVAGVALTASTLACTHPTFRPTTPRSIEEGGVRVDLERADLRRFVLDVGVDGPGAASTKIAGAWVESSMTQSGDCRGPLAAGQIEKASPSAGGAAYRIHFDDRLLRSLEHHSRLTLQVMDASGAARCLSLPLSGTDPALRWTYEPWGESPPFSGRGLGVWFPVGAARSRYAAGFEAIQLRFGRWLGPVRAGAGAGFGLTCCTQHDPNAMVEIPTMLFAEVFPIVSGHFALGLGASYVLRPSWFENDDRGFELLHGPTGSIELGYLPYRPLGFLEGPRYGTIDLDFSISRWLPDGGATVLGVSIGFR